MYENDYIMRLIKEIVRTILKLLFNIDTKNSGIDLLNDQQEQDTLNKLLFMADKGKINEAENYIFELSEDNDLKHLKTAVLFYSYLNDKDDEFLKRNNYSREEIKLGLKDLLTTYNLTDMLDIFL